MLFPSLSHAQPSALSDQPQLESGTAQTAGPGPRVTLGGWPGWTVTSGADYARPGSEARIPSLRHQSASLAQFSDRPSGRSVWKPVIYSSARRPEMLLQNGPVTCSAETLVVPRRSASPHEPLRLGQRASRARMEEPPQRPRRSEIHNVFVTRGASRGTQPHWRVLRRVARLRVNLGTRAAELPVALIAGSVPYAAWEVYDPYYFSNAPKRGTSKPCPAPEC